MVVLVQDGQAVVSVRTCQYFYRSSALAEFLGRTVRCGGLCWERLRAPRVSPSLTVRACGCWGGGLFAGGCRYTAFGCLDWWQIRRERCARLRRGRGLSRCASSRAGRWLECTRRIVLDEGTRSAGIPRYYWDFGPAFHTCIARLAGVGHQRVLVELSRLVVGGLEDRRTAHGSLGCCNDGEVLARDSKEDLPMELSASASCRCYGMR